MNSRSCRVCFVGCWTAGAFCCCIGLEVFAAVFGVVEPNDEGAWLPVVKPKDMGAFCFCIGWSA